MIIFYSVLLLVFSISLCLEPPGPYNLFYSIPYYKGSRVLERQSKQVILNDEPSLFYWQYNYNVDYLGNLWVADKEQHSIFYISKENQTWNAIFKVTGTDGESGSRDGNIVQATFNRPSSIAVYDKNESLIYQHQNLKPVLLDETQMKECLASGKAFPHLDQKCRILNDKYNTQRTYKRYGTLIDETYPNDVIDADRVKYLPFAEIPPSLENFSYPVDYDPRIVYIADSANHCVRRLTVEEIEIDTVAGVCGTKGFVDGPLGSNLLDTPELVGVDPQGFVFIYDAGNSYIRMLDQDLVMTTMIQGACMQYKTVLYPDIPFQLNVIPMLCYRKWTDDDGYFSDVQKGQSVASTSNTTCINEHYVNCNNPKRPLIKESNFTQIKPKIAGIDS